MKSKLRIKVKEYKNHWCTIPDSIKASVSFIICNVIMRGVSFFTLPIFTRLLSEKEFGQLTIYNSWSEIIVLFGTLTIWGGVFNTGFVKYENDKDGYVSTVLGLGTLYSGAFSIVGLCFSRQIGELLDISNILSTCIFVHIMALIPYNIWLAAQKYDYKYKTPIVISICISVINPLLAILLVVSTDSYKVEARVISGIIVEVIIGIILYCTTLKKGRRFYEKSVWIMVFKGSVVLLPHYLSMLLLAHSDRIIIGYLCGEEDAAAYGIAYTFAMMVSLITTGIESSYTPYVFRNIKNKKVDRIADIATTISLLIAIICFVCICFIPDIYRVMLAESYYDALVCIPPVVISAYFMFESILFSSVEFYYEQTKYVASVSTLFGVLNIILNYVFINYFGFVAAAYTTLFCYLGICVAHAFIMRYVLKKNGVIRSVYCIRDLIIISTILTCISLLITVLYGNDLLRYIMIAIIVTLFVKKRSRFISVIKRIKGDE